MYDDRAAIDQTVERAELRLGRRDGSRDRCRFGKVQADGERIPADCGAGGFDRIRSNVGQRDARAFGGQLLGGCAAHAAGGAGNQDAPSLVTPRRGNLPNRQRRVSWTSEELADRIPLKSLGIEC